MPPPEGSSRFVLITGCSGGGKSTLLAELAARGHAVVEEPGRRIVRQEQATGGHALPWGDPVAFLHRAVETAIADREAAAAHSGWVFFDRGLVDAASGLQSVTGEPVLAALNAAHPYHRRVFVAPPWPEIYETDAERRHTLQAGLVEHRRLEAELPALGYQVLILPKTPVAERADFVLAHLRDADAAALR
jgi:predicted ATPase